MYRQGWLRHCLIALGVTWFLRVAYRYRGKYRDAMTETLIQDLGVSQMRPGKCGAPQRINCRARSSGAFYSPDLSARPDGHYVPVWYRASIPFARFFFAISAAQDYIGQEVTVEGMFRRGARPYVEMIRIIGPGGKVHRSYSRWIQFALAIAATVIGCYWLFLHETQVELILHRELVAFQQLDERIEANFLSGREPHLHQNLRVSVLARAGKVHNFVKIRFKNL